MSRDVLEIAEAADAGLEVLCGLVVGRLPASWGHEFSVAQAV
jgi:hypothetical protein